MKLLTLLILTAKIPQNNLIRCDKLKIDGKSFDMGELKTKEKLNVMPIPG